LTWNHRVDLWHDQWGVFCISVSRFTSREGGHASPLYLGIQVEFLGGVVVIEASIVGGIIKAFGKRLASSSRKWFVGLAFLILGFLYGSYVALPIPNPPPQGMQ
jgi:hypothetical protein